MHLNIRIKKRLGYHGKQSSFPVTLNDYASLTDFISESKVNLSPRGCNSSTTTTLQFVGTCAKCIIPTTKERNACHHWNINMFEHSSIMIGFLCIVLPEAFVKPTKSCSSTRSARKPSVVKSYGIVREKCPQPPFHRLCCTNA